MLVFYFGELSSYVIHIGFCLRVDSEASLSDLRSELGSILGLDRIAEKYIFLKCVGRSFALVKLRQERELTVKSFTPPFAPFPEIYLLPVLENDSDLCSSTFSPETLVSSTDHHSHNLLRPTCAPANIKEPIKFPSINIGPRQSVLMQEAEEEESDEDAEYTDTPLPTYSAHEQMESINKQHGMKNFSAGSLLKTSCACVVPLTENLPSRKAFLK
nr:spermatogenesis-associated protein 1-like [Danio rerio]|eukprot:XP_021328134.1 spermatogenesis-associated protein 1-like [Danio rerio]